LLSIVIYLIVIYGKQAYTTCDANSRSDGRGSNGTVENLAGTNKVTFKSEICGAAERALMPVWLSWLECWLTDIDGSRVQTWLLPHLNLFFI